jgi:hypothetical protein
MVRFPVEGAFSRVPPKALIFSRVPMAMYMRECQYNLHGSTRMQYAVSVCGRISTCGGKFLVELGFGHVGESSW